MGRQITFLIFIAQLAFGQLGGSSGFVATSASGATPDITTPLDSTGVGHLPIAWYDFSVIGNLYQDHLRTTPVAANNDPIEGVVDGSGNANHINVNLGDTERPLYKTGIQNGKSCALFDGSNDYLTRASFVGGVQAQPFMVFIVGQNLTAAADARCMFDAGTGSGINTMTRQWSDDVNWNVYAGTSAFYPRPSPDPSMKITATQFAKDTTWVRYNIRTVGTGVTGIGTDGINGVTLGAASTGGASKMNCYIGEVIIYAGYFTQAQTERVMRYLNNKWVCY